IKAIIRRVEKNSKPEELSETTEKIIKFDDIVIYPEKFEVYVKEKKVEFTPKEFELLVYLAENKNRILSREQLLLAIWDYDFSGETRIVDVHISHLRDKIEENPKKPYYIKTARGFGYKLEVPK
ncbi:MAG: response regulator transcription factor, partial [Alkalibacterium sp.]|uniref:winged helix-turn-helix domain-containing protein n=1 Tax=Alkalibacterium sp. TaxID=1872447 RepID=UPI0039707ED8